MVFRCIGSNMPQQLKQEPEFPPWSSHRMILTSVNVFTSPAQKYKKILSCSVLPFYDPTCFHRPRLGFATGDIKRNSQGNKTFSINSNCFVLFYLFTTAH